MRIAALSDTHLAPPGEPAASWHGPLDFDGAAERLRLAARGATERRSDVLVMCGDLTNHGDGPSLQRLLAMVSGFPGLVILVPGNHDAEGSTDALATAVRASGAASVRLATIDWQPLADRAVIAGTDLSRTGTAGSFAVRAPSGAPATAGTLAIWLSHYPVTAHLGRLHAAGLRYPGDAAGSVEVESALGSSEGPVLVLSGHLHVRDAVASGPILEVSCSPSIEAPFEMTFVDVDRRGGGLEVIVDRVPLAPWEVADPPVLAARWQRWGSGDGWSLVEEAGHEGVRSLHVDRPPSRSPRQLEPDPPR